MKKMCRWHIFSVGPASYAGRVSPDRTGETLSKPISFSLPEKEWFLESKEKGAPKRVERLQIVIRRPVFTPPLRTSTVHRRLRRRNRGRPWSYPTFFRRLRGWASERGGTAWCSLYCGIGFRLFYLFTFSSYFSLWGATTPARQTTLRSGAGAAISRPIPKTQKGAAPAMQGRLLLYV